MINFCIVFLLPLCTWKRYMPLLSVATDKTSELFNVCWSKSWPLRLKTEQEILGSSVLIFKTSFAGLGDRVNSTFNSSMPEVNDHGVPFLFPQIYSANSGWSIKGLRFYWMPYTALLRLVSFVLTGSWAFHFRSKLIDQFDNPGYLFPANWPEIQEFILFSYAVTI